MGYNYKDFVGASDEAVKENLRKGYWPIYRHYCVVGPAGVLRCTGLDHPELVQQLNSDLYDPSKAAHDLYVKAPTLLQDLQNLEETVARDGEAFWEYFNSVEEWYSPLSFPALFLEFAGLVEEGEVSIDVMLDWVERYGVLGFEGREYRGTDPQMPDLMGGPMDNLRSFAFEARKANAVLRLYEAATATGGPDVEGISKYGDYIVTPFIENRFGDRLEDPLFLKEIALDWVGGTVRRVVADDCYPELYQEGDTFRSGCGFKSLLGAMYLQMTWLMTATGEFRRCQRPGCNKIIISGRKDKKFCDVNCRVKNFQHRPKIAKR